MKFSYLANSTARRMALVSLLLLLTKETPFSRMRIKPGYSYPWLLNPKLTHSMVGQLNNPEYSGSSYKLIHLSEGDMNWSGNYCLDISGPTPAASPMIIPKTGRLSLN